MFGRHPGTIFTVNLVTGHSTYVIIKPKIPQIVYERTGIVFIDGVGDTQNSIQRLLRWGRINTIQKTRNLELVKYCGSED